MKKTIILSSVAVLGALAASAQATLIDFNSLAEGTLVTNQFAGVTFAAGTGGLAVPNPVSTTQGFATNTGMGVTALSGGDVGGGVGADRGDAVDVGAAPSGDQVLLRIAGVVNDQVAGWTRTGARRERTQR